MISEQHLDSLLNRLSENLKALQSTYSEFTSNCSFIDQKSLELRSEISDKQKDIQNLVLNIKQALTLDSNIVQAAKESFIKLSLKLKTLPKSQNLENIFKELNLASKHLLKLEHSSLACVEQRLDDLLELIMKKRDLNLLYTKKLESQIILNESKNNSTDLKKSGKEKFCSRCETVFEESRTILNKMNQLVHKINSQAKMIPLAESSNLSKSYSVQTSPSNTKLNENLQNELRKLRHKVRQYEEKEFFSLRTESNLNLSMEGMSKLNEKIEELENSLVEKEFRIECLLKTAEQNAVEKKKTFELVAGLKRQLEEKILHQDSQIKKIEDKYLSQIQSLKSRISKQAQLEKQNQSLTTENSKLKSDSALLKKELNDSKAKLSQTLLQLQKNSHISNLLASKDEEINNLENELSTLSSKTKELQSEYEITKDCLQLTESELAETKKNLLNLFSEYDLLKNSKIADKSSGMISDIAQINQNLEGLNDAKQIKDYLEQVQELQSIVNDLTEELTFYQAKAEEQEEFIKELQSNPEDSGIKKSGRPKSYEFFNSSGKQFNNENKGLAQSKSFIADQISMLKSSHFAEVSELQLKLQNSEKKIEELTQAVNYQQYLCTKLEKDRKSLTNSKPGSRVLTRQNTSPAVSTDHLKSLSALQKLCENQKIDLNIIALIGVELDEDDPSKFLDRIIEIKRERDSSYMISEKYEDLLNELKEELDEQDEYNLLACVVNLKEQVKN